MFPTPQMTHHLAHMHQKPPSLPLHARDHLYRRPLISAPSEHASIYNSAGAGCFARPTDYVQILTVLLNNGVSPITGARILSEGSVEEMFRNQIPDFPDFGRRGVKSAKGEYTNDIEDFYPQPKEEPQGWGLTFMLTLHEGATGRGRNTSWWAGLANREFFFFLFSVLCYAFNAIMVVRWVCQGQLYAFGTFCSSRS